jgi:hypothetical protein
MRTLALNDVTRLSEISRAAFLSCSAAPSMSAYTPGLSVVPASPCCGFPVALRSLVWGSLVVEVGWRVTKLRTCGLRLTLILYN